MRQTNDGGYIIAGWSLSTDYDKALSYGSADWWILKLDDTGAIQWQKTLGGSASEMPYSVKQTTDGGYVIAGFTGSNNGNITSLQGATDEWIVKLDPSGNLQWQKTLGGSAPPGGEQAWNVIETLDGGYIAAGVTASNNGDVSFNHGQDDYWVTKLNSQGSLLWQKTYGGSKRETAFSIKQTLDSGFVLIGRTESNDGDVTFNHSVLDDAWLVKINQSGAIQWEKSFGGSALDCGYDILQLTDSIFIFSATSNSSNGDVTSPFGADDYWVVKVGPTTPSYVPDVNKNAVVVYPTVTKGTIYIQLPENDSETIITVSRVDGKRVDTQLESIGNLKMLNIVNASAGLYKYSR